MSNLFGEQKYSISIFPTNVYGVYYVFFVCNGFSLQNDRMTANKLLTKQKTFFAPNRYYILPYEKQHIDISQKQLFIHIFSHADYSK